MANPFGEGTYPSPIEGLRRSYEAFMADQARRHGEEGNQRQQMFMFMAKRMLAQREEEEGRRYQEAQEAEEREYQEGLTTEQRAYAQTQRVTEREHQIKLEGMRQVGRTTLKRTPTPSRPGKAPKPGALTDMEKTVISSHRKDIADASRIRKEAEAMFDSSEKTRLIERARDIEERIDRDRARVDKILKTSEQGAGQPGEHAWAQIEAGLRKKNTAEDKIRKAKAQWFKELKEGGR